MYSVDNNKPTHNSIRYLQKRIVELTQQYYNAIRDNTTFESLKAIFMKRKDLEKELSELQKGEGNASDAEVNNDNVNQNIKMNNEYSA